MTPLTLLDPMDQELGQSSRRRVVWRIASNHLRMASNSAQSLDSLAGAYHLTKYGYKCTVVAVQFMLSPPTPDRCSDAQCIAENSSMFERLPIL